MLKKFYIKLFCGTYFWAERQDGGVGDEPSLFTAGSAIVMMTVAHFLFISGANALVSESMYRDSEIASMVLAIGLAAVFHWVYLIKGRFRKLLLDCKASRKSAMLFAGITNFVMVATFFMSAILRLF